MSFITELNEILTGDIYTSDLSRDAMSRDMSLFSLRPECVVAPHATDDVAAAMRYAFKRSQSGGSTPVTCRGKGNHFAGGAIGEGIILRMSDHFTKISEVQNDTIRIEAGALLGDVNRVLKKQGKWIPSQPLSSDSSTVGGLVAKNAAGSNAWKYGSIGDYVVSLKAVLSDGSEIEAKHISYEELAQKRSLPGFEGELYSQIADLRIQHNDAIENARPAVRKNSSGYALWDLADEYGFNLHKLFIGSEGTLGVITEIEFAVHKRPQYVGILVAHSDSIEHVVSAVDAVRHLEPSAVDVVDSSLLSLIRKTQFQGLHTLIDGSPSAVLMCEFDGDDPGEIERKLKAAESDMEAFTYETKMLFEESERVKYRSLLVSGSMLYKELSVTKRPVPCVEDCVVSKDNFANFANQVRSIMAEHKTDFAMWGHVGAGEMHVRPVLDISTQEGRDLVFRLADKIYSVVAELGGSISGEHGDGMMRAPYIYKVFNPEMIETFQETRRIFDPHGVLNPHVKTGATVEFLKQHMVKEFSIPSISEDVSV